MEAARIASMAVSLYNLERSNCRRDEARGGVWTGCGLAESMEVNQELGDAPAEEVDLGDGEVCEKELPREYE